MLRLRRLLCRLVGHDQRTAAKITERNRLRTWRYCRRCASRTGPAFEAPAILALAYLLSYLSPEELAALRRN